jgi:hypothetical protein
MIALLWFFLTLFASPFKSKIRDRDQVYGAAVKNRLRAMGIRDKPIAPGSCVYRKPHPY